MHGMFISLYQYVKKSQPGVSLVEALLAVTLFGIFLVAIGGALNAGQESAVLSGKRARAVALADEGLEAVRTIRDAGFTNLVDGTYGIVTTSNQWNFSSSTSDTTDMFTRQVKIGTIDTDTKVVTSTVTWQQNLQRTGSVEAVTYLTNWHKLATASGGGMLVYGDGGLASDRITYRTLSSSGVWSPTSSAADIDTGSTNRTLRVVQLAASATRNEKIMISRHYDGSAIQYIYAQVYNGSSWGSVQLLTTITSLNFLDVQNFSGTYLANGDFMVVYSDNTAIPKFRTWNGTTWSSPVALPNIGGIPSYIVARARPGTNEVMAVFFDQSLDTNSVYFNGGTYTTGNWTLHAEHATQAPANNKQYVDFAWSPNNPLIGGLIYANNTNEKAINIKIWTANGSGSGSWSGSAATTNQGSNIGGLVLVGRKGANEFIACDKDANATPSIICYRSNFTPLWTNPTNQTIAAATETGVQKSFDIAFESISGDPALAVYSNTTALPQLKKYAAASGVWDVSATPLSSVVNPVATVRLKPFSGSNDILILMGNTAQDLFSAVWDGTNNVIYSTPTGYTLTAHGINGSASTNLWYDFAWNEF